MNSVQSIKKPPATNGRSLPIYRNNYMEPTIHKTTDYDQFKTKRGNRPVGRSYVRSLAEGISKQNMLSANPIIVNEEMEVIDGQHRLAAAKELRIPIYYVVFNPASLAEIQLLNNNVRRWTFLNFMDSYIELGREEYKIFKDFYKKYEFPYGATVTLLQDPEELSPKSRTGQAFKEGKLQITDLQKSVERAEIVLEFLKYAYATVKESARFYDAVFYLMRKHPQRIDQILERLKVKGIRIYRLDKLSAYLQQFEDIINDGNYGKRIILY